MRLASLCVAFDLRPRAIRYMLVGVALLVLLAGTAAPALAHVTASPSFIAQGEGTQLAIAVPNERAPRSTTGLVIELPVGITLLGTASPPGWSSDVANNRVTWTGGRISGTDSITFTMRVRATAPPGTAALSAAQRYDDGASVSWKTALTIVPGPAASGSSRARLLLGIGAASVIVLATLLALRRSRSRIV